MIDTLTLGILLIEPSPQKNEQHCFLYAPHILHLFPALLSTAHLIITFHLFPSLHLEQEEEQAGGRAIL